MDAYPNFKFFEFKATIQIPARDIEDANMKMHQLMGLLCLPYSIEEIIQDETPNEY